MSTDRPAHPIDYRDLFAYLRNYLAAVEPERLLAPAELLLLMDQLVVAAERGVGPLPGG